MAVIKFGLVAFHVFLTLVSDNLLVKASFSNSQCQADVADALEVDSNAPANRQNATFDTNLLYAPTQPATMEAIEGQQRFNPIPYAKKLLKRDCTMTNSGTKETCGNNKCCQHSTNGWCCGQDADCGNLSGSPPAACTFPKTDVTVLATSTSIISITETDTASHATATDVSTQYTTVITVITNSNVDIATVIQTITVTAGSDQRKRRARTAIAPPTSVPTRSVELATPSASPCQPDRHRPPVRQTIGNANSHARLFNFKRQVSTVTDTVTKTSTAFQTKIIHVTRTIGYTALQTITSTITSTFTSAVNAKTTVTQLSTYTTLLGNTNQASGSTTSQTSGTDAAMTPSPSAGGNDATVTRTSAGGNDATVAPSPSADGDSVSSGGGGSTLSTGAKAGIAIGTAGGSLIICIILGFIFRRRRKNKKAETAELINAAVAAARNDASSPAPGAPSAKGKPIVHAQSNSTPSPPDPSSPRTYAPIPVPMRDLTASNGGWDNSTVGHSPVSGYSSPPGHEMSATPMPLPMQYQMQNQYYPPPPNADNQRGRQEVYQPYRPGVELAGQNIYQHEMPGN